MRRKITKAPGRLECWILLARTGLGARREARAQEPYKRREGSGAFAIGTVPYQDLVQQRVVQWVDSLASAFRPAQEVWMRGIQEAFDYLGLLNADLLEIREFVQPRLALGDLYRKLVVPVGIAEGVQIAGVWQLVEDLFLPLALLAAVGISLVSAIAAILVGVFIGALVFDEPSTPNELSPRQRSLALVGALCLGALVVVLAVVLALSQDRFWMWFSIALVVACIEAAWGASLYESRFHRALEHLQKQRATTFAKGRIGCAGLSAARDGAMAAGRHAVGRGDRVLQHGSVVFERAYRRRNWRTPRVVPAVPVPALLDDGGLQVRLLVPINDDMARIIALFEGLPAREAFGEPRRLRPAS